MRVDNSIKNMKYNIFSQILNLLIQFVSRTFFIKILGNEYLGINGLFSNILTILSLADMGIGTVLIYSMYKPLAENNEEKMKALMNIYKKIYNIIALTVLIIGLCITPFLQVFIKDMPNIQHIRFIFILYLLNTVVSYLCVYKISIINADQKNYIVTTRQQIFNIIANFIMIMVLVTTHNFILYLIVQMLFSIISNIYLSSLAEKMYPFIKDTKGYKLTKEEKRQIKKDTFAMMLHKIGGVVVGGTDNLIMSAMIGLEAVGIYSNYLLIINAIKKFTTQYFNSMSASIGNLNAMKDKEYSYDIFKKVFFGNFWIFTFCSICLFCLLNPFIEIWVGIDYTFHISIVAAIVISFYIEGMRQTVLIFREAMGIFTKDQLKPVIEAIVNLIVSVMLTLKFGIIGIILGTIISMLFVCVWIEARILFKYGFSKNVIEFFKIYAKYLVIGVVGLILTYGANLLIKGNTITTLILRFTVSIIVSNLVILISTFKTEEFKYLYNIIFSKIKNRKEK